MIYRVIRTAVVTITLCAGLVFGASFWADRAIRRNHQNLRALVVSQYYASAARGEVASPVSEPGAVQAVARCGLPLPFIVRVKTSSGERRIYLAQGHPHFRLDAEYWTFTSRDEIDRR